MVYLKMRIIGTCFMKNEEDDKLRQMWLMESYDKQNRIIIVAEEKLRYSEKTEDVLEIIKNKDFLSEMSNE